MSFQALDFTKKIELSTLYQTILRLEEELEAAKKVLVSIMPKVKQKTTSWNRLCQWGQGWTKKQGFLEKDIIKAIYESRYSK